MTAGRPSLLPSTISPASDRLCAGGRLSKNLPCLAQAEPLHLDVCLAIGHPASVARARHDPDPSFSTSSTYTARRRSSERAVRPVALPFSRLLPAFVCLPLYGSAAPPCPLAPSPLYRVLVALDLLLPCSLLHQLDWKGVHADPAKVQQLERESRTRTRAQP